jgi:hypothetical protein
MNVLLGGMSPSGPPFFTLQSGWLHSEYVYKGRKLCRGMKKKGNNTKMVFIYILFTEYI